MKKLIKEQGSAFPFIFELLKKNPQLESMISQPLQFNLIVDANIIIKELIWLTKKRKKENAPKIISSIITTIEPIAQNYRENKNNAEVKKTILTTHYNGLANTRR